MSLVAPEETQPTSNLRQSKPLFWLGCLVSDFLLFLPILLASNPEPSLWITFSVALIFSVIPATVSLIRTKDRTLRWSRIESIEPPESMVPVADNLWYHGCAMLFLAPVGFIIRTWIAIHFWHYLLYRDKSLDGALAQFWDTRTLIVGSIAAFALGFLKPKHRIDIFEGLFSGAWNLLKRLLRLNQMKT